MMSLLTDNIRSKITALKSLADDILDLVDQLDDGESPSLQCLPIWPPNTGTWAFPYSLTGDVDNNSANLSVYDAVCNAAPDGSVPCIGNSIVQNNDFSTVDENLNFVNLGYGGETMRRMMCRLNAHSAHRNLMNRAKAVILHTGVCDISHPAYQPAYGPNSNHNASLMVKEFFKHLCSSMDGKWVICNVLPINEPMATAYGSQNFTGFNAEIDYMNQCISQALADHCNAEYRIVDIKSRIIDANGNLKAELCLPDGGHLNSVFYNNFWNPAIKTALSELCINA
jgi:hypothetical protein